jgi:hypothetical protein
MDNNGNDEFYTYHAKMESIVSGDMAKESLALAEDEYLCSGDVGGLRKDEPEFIGMEHKNDDGDWVVTYNDGRTVKL